MSAKNNYDPELCAIYVRSYRDARRKAHKSNLLMVVALIGCVLFGWFVLGPILSAL